MKISRFCSRQVLHIAANSIRSDAGIEAAMLVAKTLKDSSSPMPLLRRRRLIGPQDLVHQQPEMLRELRRRPTLRSLITPGTDSASLANALSGMMKRRAISRMLMPSRCARRICA
ncbi:MAG: hypothetical protein U1D30_15350 [Planctomycetota bacterium]